MKIFIFSILLICVSKNTVAQNEFKSVNHFTLKVPATWNPCSKSEINTYIKQLESFSGMELKAETEAIYFEESILNYPRFTIASNPIKNLNKVGFARYMKLITDKDIVKLTFNSVKEALPNLFADYTLSKPYVDTSTRMFLYAVKQKIFDINSLIISANYLTSERIVSLNFYLEENQYTDYRNIILNTIKSFRIDSNYEISIEGLESDPSLELAEIFFKSGNAKTEQGDFRGAIQDYDKSIKLTSNYAEIYNNRGVAKNKIADYSAAILDYDKAISLNPKYGLAFCNRGFSKINLEDYSGALQDYNKAIELNYEGHELYYNRGIAKSHLNDLRGSIKDYDKSISLNPTFAKAYLNRGSMKSKLNDDHGAIQDFDRSIKLNAKNGLAYYNRGVSNFKLEDYQLAIQNYTKAIELDPKYSAAFFNRGLSRIQINDWRGAIQDLNKAIELQPKDADAFLNRAIAKLNLKDYKGAMPDLTKALEFNKNANTYFLRGTVKGMLENWRAAIQDYTKVIELDSDHVQAYFSRGIARMVSGDTRGGCLDLKIAAKLGDADAKESLRKYCK